MAASLSGYLRDTDARDGAVGASGGSPTPSAGAVEDIRLQLRKDCKKATPLMEKDYHGPASLWFGDACV